MHGKKIVIAGVLAAVFLFIAVSAGFMIAEYNGKGEGKGESVTVEIVQGQSTWDIASSLKKAGLIRSRLVFMLKTRSMGAGGKLRYGSFAIRKGTGMETLIGDLISGGAQRESVMFTVPEGYTVELIADKLEKEGICSAQKFLEAVREEYDYDFLDTVPEEADVEYRLQGFLFPDTYAIDENTKPRDIVIMMLDQFDRKFTSQMRDKARELGRTIYEVVTEASLIERETALDSERETVAGVIENRLDRDMLLQIDPTALYPLTGGRYDKDTVTAEDIQIDSPYNTYVYKGLPVGPIACPGLASVKAALNPAVHDYLYYHTDTVKNDGSHIFTKTYEEHLNTQ